MYSPGIRSTIGGSVSPFQNEDPLGNALADSFEQGAANAVQGVANWYQRASADQAGISDDLLRLMAGGVRNTTNAWKAATAEQEGIHDDILRGAAWTAGKGLQLLDAPGHYGGKGLSHIARMVGVDERIGGAIGYVGADLLTGAILTKAAKVTRATRALRRADPITAGGLLKPGPGAARSFKSGSFVEDAWKTYQAGGRRQEDLIAFGKALDIEEATKQARLAEAWKSVDKAKARGSSNIDNYLRNVRSIQGTPGEAMELAAKEFIETATDPRIQERVGMRGAYGKRIGKKAYEKGEKLYPGQQIPKPINQALRKEGLEQTVEAHHLISNYDSATLAYQLDKVGATAKHQVYEYILNKHQIIPGDYDLNLANIPTGVHRLERGGNLHAWLNRMGFEDYWRSFSKANPGPVTVEQMAGAVDTYFDEVFYPMMVKLQDLMIKNPDNFDWEGAYFPQYLVDNAKKRLKEIQKPYRPWQSFEPGSTAADVKMDQVHDLASQAGFDTPGQRYWENIDGIQIDARPGFGTPEIKKAKRKKKK